MHFWPLPFFPSKHPAEAETLLAFGRSMEAANLAIFLKFENANKLDINFVLSLQKIMGGNETGLRKLEQNWGCAPGPGLKPPLRSDERRRRRS